MKRYRLLSFVFCALVSLRPASFYAQNKKAGLEDVKVIYNRMYGEIPLLNTTTYVNYKVTTKLRGRNNSGNLISSLDIRCYTNKSTVWFLSDDLCLYRDKQNTFTVIPKRKVVYWAQSVSNGKPEDRIGQLKRMHDSIFKNCKNVSSEKITEDGKEIHQVKVALEKKWADLFRIKTITFYLDSEKNSLLKQVIEYSEQKKIEYVEYLFKEVNYNYTAMNIDLPVKSMFLKGGSELKGPYNDYQLIDVRNKAKH